MKHLITKQIESALDLSSGDTASDEIDIGLVDNVMINIDCTGVTDNTGTFAVEHRLKKSNAGGGQYTSWGELTLSAVPTLADANKVFAISLNQLPPGQIRVTYSSAGGTPDGAAEIWFSACSVG